jgi:hypothetical protein
MAEKSIASGVVMPYGVGIGDALSRRDTPIGELLALRDHTRAIVGAQGDLVAALKELDAEIARRGPGTGAAPAPASARFVAEIGGLELPDKVKAEICQAVEKAVMAEIAKLDSGGDMVATPLSQIKSFGLGFGSHTGGKAIVARNLIR